MTIDSGHLYIAEHVIGTNNFRLDEFGDATGAFLRQFPQDPAVAEADHGVAVAHASGDVYDAGGTSVAVFSGAGVLQGTWTGLSAVGGVAVDNSALHWPEGDVYVLGGAEVDLFKPGIKGAIGSEEAPEAAAPPLLGTCPGEGETVGAPGCEPAAGLIPFTKPEALAVSQSTGEILVADQHEGNVDVVDVFKPVEPLPGLHEFQFVRQLTGTVNGAWENSSTLPVQRRVTRIAAGAGGDIYVREKVIRIEGTVDELFVDQFSSEGRFVGRLSGTPAGPFKGASAADQSGSVAVDPASGDVFVGNFEATGFVDVFGPDLVIPDVTVTPVTSFHVDPASHTWGTALNGTVNPLEAGAATCTFEYGPTTSYGTTVKCAHPVPNVNNKEPVESEPVTGLPPDTSYHFRTDALNANEQLSTGLGPEDEGSFTTPGPGVVSESASAVASSSATLQASIVPHEEPSAPQAHPVSYFFEYGPEPCEVAAHACVQTPLPPGSTIGPGEAAVPVAQHLQGLAAAREYHYRVVAVAEVETGGSVLLEQFPGADHTFTTEPPSGGPGTESALPDGRRYELVSPPDKHGALILKPGALHQATGLVQAAADGGAVSYVTDAPTESSPAGYANALQVLSLRGPAGWGSRDIAVPHAAATGVAVAQAFVSEYVAFSKDLSLGVVQPFGGFDPAVSPEASEQTPYERSDFTAGGICRPSAAQEAEGASCYQPLLTGKQPFADVTSGLPFSTREAECPPEYGNAICAPEFVTATPDARHVLLQSQSHHAVALTGSPGDEGGLYEWSAGAPPAQRLALVSVLPDEKDAPETIPGGEVSDDGSLVFFTDAGRLYMRDVPLGRTIELGGAGAGFERVVASAGGHRVLFSGQECEVKVTAGELECPLLAGGVGAGGSLLGASSDGSVLYFTSPEALTGSEANARREVAVAGQSNLYVRAHGTVTFIAVLTPGHLGNVRIYPDGGWLVSPDGGWLAFMSDRSLTGYDNSGPACVPVLGAAEETRGYTPGGCSELYVYQRSANRLVCASCNPAGARPQGPSTVPGLTQPGPGGGHQSRYLSDSGRLFFDSRDALVPQDVNGTADVYEWEPAGIPEGSPNACASSTAGYSSATGGCVGLISSGTSSEESTFLDASETGGDVFFMTTAKLSPQDTDTSYDIYDAHECTTASPCVPQAVTEPSVCTTADSCRAAPTPQPEVFGAPSSSTFSGPANIPPPPPTPAKPTAAQLRANNLAKALKGCKKDKNKHKRQACEKQAKKRYGVAKPAKKSSHGKGRA
jgi:hypothetical protein